MSEVTFDVITSNIDRDEMRLPHVYALDIIKLITQGNKTYNQKIELKNDNLDFTIKEGYSLPQPLKIATKTRKFRLDKVSGKIFTLNKEFEETRKYLNNDFSPKEGLNPINMHIKTVLNEGFQKCFQDQNKVVHNLEREKRQNQKNASQQARRLYCYDLTFKGCTLLEFDIEAEKKEQAEHIVCYKSLELFFPNFFKEYERKCNEVQRGSYNIAEGRFGDTPNEVLDSSKIPIYEESNILDNPMDSRIESNISFQNDPVGSSAATTFMVQANSTTNADPAVSTSSFNHPPLSANEVFLPEKPKTSAQASKTTPESDQNLKNSASLEPSSKPKISLPAPLKSSLVFPGRIFDEIKLTPLTEETIKFITSFYKSKDIQKLVPKSEKGAKSEISEKSEKDGKDGKEAKHDGSEEEEDEDDLQNNLKISKAFKTSLRGKTNMKKKNGETFIQIVDGSKNEVLSVVTENKEAMERRILSTLMALGKQYCSTK